MAKNKTKRERFERVAAYRVDMVLKFLDSLSNCANKGNYEYSESDARKMFSAIRSKVKEAEATFDKELGRDGKNSFKF
jgi:hypothetical protein